MKISTKLRAGFATISVLVVVVALVGNYGIRRMNQLLEEYALTEGKIVESAQRSRANINILRRYEKDAFINIESPEKVAEYTKKWRDGYEQCFKRFDAIDSLLVRLRKGA